MIHWLLHYFVDELLTETGAFPNSVAVDLGTPINSPGVGFKAGELQILQQPARVISDELQPQSISETFAVSSNTYALAKEPIIDSLLARLVINAAGERVLLSAGTDFTVDYPNRTLTLAANILTTYPDAVSLLVEYKFVGIASLREFEQVFLVEVLGDNFEQAEQLASITAAILLTNQERAKVAFNASEHTQGEYLSRHIMSQYFWQSGEALELGSAQQGYRLSFIVQGHIYSIKGIPEGEYGVIESVHSPGQSTSPGQPINVTPELG